MDAFNKNKFRFKPGKHKGENVIWIHFGYDGKLIKHLREYTDAKWGNTENAWYVPDNPIYRRLFGLKNSSYHISHEVMNKIHEINQTEMENYVNLMISNGYSPNSIRTYSLEFAQLLYILKDFPVKDLDADLLKSYFLYCIKQLKLSENQIHSRINAVKFYYEKVLLKKKMFSNIQRPKKISPPSNSLNKKEIAMLYEVIKNPKHLLILKLGYDTGLKISEIVKVKISDIDPENRKVFISAQNRYANLSDPVLSLLKEYFKANKPKEFLFEGKYGGPYALRSAQAVFKNAMTKAKIKKTVGIHGARIKYNDYSLEMDADVTLFENLISQLSVNLEKSISDVKTLPSTI